MTVKQRLDTVIIKDISRFIWQDEQISVVEEGKLINSRRENYSPDQPRDEGGRFGSGGSGSKPDINTVLSEYRSFKGFQRINGGLRSGKIGADDPYVSVIDAAIRTSEGLPSHDTLYRGMSVDRETIDAQFKDGSVIRDKGFVSTTTDQEIATKCARGVTLAKSKRGDTNVVFNIRVPKGSKAIGAGNANLGIPTNEYIFARESRIKINSKSFSSNSVGDWCIVEAEYLK